MLGDETVRNCATRTVKTVLQQSLCSKPFDRCMHVVMSIKCNAIIFHCKQLWIEGFNNCDNQLYNSPAFDVLLHEIMEAPLKAQSFSLVQQLPSQPTAKVPQTNFTCHVIPNFIYFLYICTNHVFLIFYLSTWNYVEMTHVFLLRTDHMILQTILILVLLKNSQ